ncbi:hypothetical protein GQX73_g3101 [Xylaria multiplex]|uniref:Uncharacterized protein n=1 Tax=Xylaria multiplex TaxID=323545 RepID=A0A7C8J4E0_9PEZI|nr:hypothetical protein GQX73_g3101 [Xylaria multiplex]
MARTRRSNIPVEGSWRMIEGENDSFDTTIIQDAFEDDFFVSSGQSQLTSSSQDLASQDSIHDFADRADEDQVILRAPFQPSLASTRHASVDKERTPVPEFFMPTVPVSSSRRYSSARSSRTIRPVANDTPQVRRRAFRQASTDGSYHNYSTETQETHASGQADAPNRPAQHPNLSKRFTNSVPVFIFDCLAWSFSVVGMALHFAKWPVALLLALYIAIGISIAGKNVVTQSISASLQPICRIPGAPLFNFSFCLDNPNIQGWKGRAQPVEFDELMNVQSQFEQVLEDSAQGVSLPMDMKRTEASVRDLRTVIKYSDLPAREELVYEFDGYIETVRQIVDDLQAFNTHVGGAVDSVISINRWTSRFIDSVAVKREAHGSLISQGIEWVFSPFQPVAFDERMILEKYIEHSVFVSDKIQSLILEAQAILRLLLQADDHLQRINEFVIRRGNYVKEKRSEVLWDLWTFIGANNNRLHKLSAQLSLLKQVEAQRTTAVTQLLNLIHDLSDIQTKLSDLRDRVAAPGLLADTMPIPLSVHIETINAGVARLEAARIRIRAEENERLQEALARGKNGIPMIDA